MLTAVEVVRPAASVKEIVKLLVPGLVGLPVMVSPVSCSPSGRAPLLMRQVPDRWSAVVSVAE